LLWDLEHRNARDVLFESRGNTQDRDARRHIAHAQRAQHLEPSLTFGFGDPPVEPLLWLPDLVAGAVNRSLSDELGCCLQLLGTGVTLIDAGEGT